MEGLFAAIWELLLVDCLAFSVLVPIDVVVVSRNGTLFSIHACDKTVLDAIHRRLSSHDFVLLCLLDSGNIRIIITSSFGGLG